MHYTANGGGVSCTENNYPDLLHTGERQTFYTYYLMMQYGNIGGTMQVDKDPEMQIGFEVHDITLGSATYFELTSEEEIRYSRHGLDGFYIYKDGKVYHGYSGNFTLEKHGNFSQGKGSSGQDVYVSGTFDFWMRTSMTTMTLCTSLTVSIITIGFSMAEQGRNKF